MLGSLTAGQLRLRELAVDVARDVPTRDRDYWQQWHDRGPVWDLAAAVAAAPATQTDPVLAQELDWEASRTYVSFQQSRFGAREVDSVEVFGDLITGYTRGTPEGLAYRGGRKPASVYAAIAGLARGESLPGRHESGPTLLTGSGIVGLGAGANHRTLGAWLWGGGRLEARSYVVDDIPDAELAEACLGLQRAHQPFRYRDDDGSDESRQQILRRWAMYRDARQLSLRRRWWRFR